MPIGRLLRRIRELVQKNSSQSQKSLIDLLNPIIRGWAYYHSKVCARKTFEKVDHEIFQILWRWSKRRHPNKGLRWIKDKYFKTYGNQSWNFAVKEVNEGKTRIYELFKATTISIRRHRKIRAAANPFCREWTTYFAERLSTMKEVKEA